MKSETQPTHLVKILHNDYASILPTSYILFSKRPAYKDNMGLGYKVLSENGLFLYFSNNEVELVGTIN